MKTKKLKNILGSFLVLGLVACSTEKAFNQNMEKFLSSPEQVSKISDALERSLRARQEQEQQKQAQAQQEQIENQFKNPQQMDIGSSPVRGNANARVTIVEFSDFQCPYCQRGATVMEEVIKAYPNDVKLVFKNFPLSFHQQAKPAALAALAAGKQGKFWEMHDFLFTNQGSLNEASFMNFAKALKLNESKFKADMKDPKLDQAVEADIAYGSKVGVGGTPAFFINGVLVSGAQPFENFKAVIDRFLK